MSTITARVVASALICAAAPAAAYAQGRPADYPQRPIRVIVGIAPGGGLDTMTRVAAQVLSERWGQSAVVDNRPGGGTVIGMEVAAQAAPDGYTLLSASDSLKLNGIFQRASFDVRKAFVPIVRLTAQPYVLVAHPSVPVGNFQELIALAKGKPGMLSFGTPGVGTILHIGWERMGKLTGVKMVHVPYRGGAPAMIDLMAGQIHVVMTTSVTAGPHIRSGKAKAIAATGLARFKIWPDLPTLAESGLPGFRVSNAYAYFAPAGTPMAIVRAINAEVSQGMNTPDTLKKVAADGSEVASAQSPEQFRAEFDREYAELEETIRAADIRLK